MSQPKALFLADVIKADPASKTHHDEAAAELRRLHEAHEWQYKMAGDRLRRIEKLEAVNAELLGAMRLVAFAENSALDLAYCKGIARAAIAKAEGQT